MENHSYQVPAIGRFRSTHAHRGLAKGHETILEARIPGRFSLNKTLVACILWLGVNIVLQVLVALLGLTYNLNTSDFPDREFGKVSIANLSAIRDFWASETPTFSFQLGSANYYGIQKQDYHFVNNVTAPGQVRVASYGTPGMPTIYCIPDWKVMNYYFQDVDPQNPSINLISHRSINTTASCKPLQRIAGGMGIKTTITFLAEHNVPTTLNVVRVGPGAMTFVGMLNSTCGPRCAEIYALQSADNTANLNDIQACPALWTLLQDQEPLACSLLLEAKREQRLLQSQLGESRAEASLNQFIL